MKGKRAVKGNYMKKVLILCFVQLIIFDAWQMIVFTITGNEATTLIQEFHRFWGLEVGLLMLKKMMDKHNKQKQLQEDIIEEEPDYE